MSKCSFLSYAAGAATALCVITSPVSAADLALVSAPAQQSANIEVSLNHARIIKLSRPASTVIIGNPEIADATVRDSKTIVLTGRSFGRTNMVILDNEGTPIIDERIAVSPDERELLKVYRRADVEALSCEPYCERAYLSSAEVQSIQALREANEGAGGN